MIEEVTFAAYRIMVAPNIINTFFLISDKKFFKNSKKYENNTTLTEEENTIRLEV